MMPAKMISETPLPIPYSEMSSPNHMSSTEPAVMVAVYAATSLAGARLKHADCERIALLQPKVAPGSIGKRFGDELRRLASEASPPHDAGIVAT
jgi:hypothetical protein